MLQSTLTGPSNDVDAGIPQLVVDDPPARVDEVSRPLRARDCVGRYRIERQLGRGGMGVVYGARDRALGRRVALKLVRQQLRPPTRSDQFTLRLRREARALARLSHPNVVGLYDLGSAGNGVFLAMEFIEGDHLARTLVRDRPGWRRIVALFEQAGRGLSAAHAAGIVHRDFKPTNVIVGPDEHVTVVDFGLACGTDRHDDDPSDPAGTAEDDAPCHLSRKLTDANVVIGTRGYMAPEQLLGLPVGPAADQFAFCVSLFEALYRSRPYPGANAVETAKAFAARSLVEPADRGDVPPHVHEALLRGLSVEPNLRFESMDALLAALSPEPTPRRRVGVAALVFGTAAASALITAWIGTATASPAPVAASSVVECSEPHSSTEPHARERERSGVR